jgi:aconitate hydratase
MLFDAMQTLRTLEVQGRSYGYFALAAAEEAGLSGIGRLPCTLKILLENLLRRQAAGNGCGEEIEALVDWLVQRRSDREIGFVPVRVLMPESSGIPLLGDMAAMRDAMVRLGGDPGKIGPVIPVDFIVDHSVIVETSGNPDALARNMDLEFAQNKERYEFLHWGVRSFSNIRVIPPGAGICHQINLEHLARIVWTSDAKGRRMAYPDSVIGMDSHTAMINALGVVGWGVGGLEGGAAAFGEPISVLIPEVIGCRLTGRLRPGVTSTDLVLTITEVMRSHTLIGKFVEFFGQGVGHLTLPERATVANMTPEYGATMGFFAVDGETLRFLEATGRDPQQVALIEAYSKAQGLWRDAETAIPLYSEIIEIDMGAVEPCVAGPSRPQARVPLAKAPQAFRAAYPGAAETLPARESDSAIRNGDVVIAAITSCTNTSNPSVMIGAGLLARNARRRGLKTKPWVKTSLSLGSRAVAGLLAQSGLQESLDELGFHVTGFGCMTCMGNSGPLAEPIVRAIEHRDLAAVAVLSGNRNFDGRIHSAVRANFLASPPLVVAYALAGSIDCDLANAPLGNDEEGSPVYLRDIWPGDDEIQDIATRTLSASLFKDCYRIASEGTVQWRQIVSESGATYPWNPRSTFIRRPPFFEAMTKDLPAVEEIRGAHVLAMFGDLITTDHISPIGTIPPNSPAGAYLQSVGVAPKDFINYAARRLNHDVMIRGAFANIRIRNEMTPGIEGSSTKHMPGGAHMSVFDAAERYRKDGVPLVVVAGFGYGAGSSRDWAAKGTGLLGVRAVIAESFERIHRSNLIGAGVLPLQFTGGVTRRTLKLDGSEVFDITGLHEPLTPCGRLACTVTRASGEKETITLLMRLDTKSEVEYYRHGGILKYLLRRAIGQGGVT